MAMSLRCCYSMSGTEMADGAAGCWGDEGERGKMPRIQERRGVGSAHRGHKNSTLQPRNSDRGQ
eukprot:1974337-Rhodomonas_salina.1